MHCVPSYQFDCWNFLPFFWHQKAHVDESGVRRPSGSKTGGSASVAAVDGDEAADDDGGGADDGCGAVGAFEAMASRPSGSLSKPGHPDLQGFCLAHTRAHPGSSLQRAGGDGVQDLQSTEVGGAPPRARHGHTSEARMTTHVSAR